MELRLICFCQISGLQTFRIELHWFNNCLSWMFEHTVNVKLVHRKYNREALKAERAILIGALLSCRYLSTDCHSTMMSEYLSSSLRNIQNVGLKREREISHTGDHTPHFIASAGG